jgi:Cytochrome c
VLGLSAFWLVSAPRPLPASAIPAHTANAANGELLYNAGGCKSCHKPNPDVAGLDQNLPSGGAPFKTPIGILYPPNLTPDIGTGIGAWSDIEFVNAVQRGISRDGQYLIPAFPYTSYAKMPVEDVLDIRAYLISLPPVASPKRDSGMPLAFILRRGSTAQAIAENATRRATFSWPATPRAFSWAALTRKASARFQACIN